MMFTLDLAGDEVPSIAYTEGENFLIADDASMEYFFASDARYYYCCCCCTSLHLIHHVCGLFQSSLKELSVLAAPATPATAANVKLLCW